jgi:hypothetical protein
VATDWPKITRDECKGQQRNLTSNPAGDPQPVQVFWQMKGPSGRILTCAAYQGDKSQMVELRVGYTYVRSLVIEHAANLVVARQRAAQLRDMLGKQDGFELLR